MKKNKQKIVITYGTFDFLHIGHINILRRARELGDRLIVGLSTDEFNQEKHKQSFSSFSDRKTILESIRYVDEVIPERCWAQKTQDIVDHQVDVFVMGDDWLGEFDFLKDHCDVIYLPRTPDISSSKIKSAVLTI